MNVVASFACNNLSKRSIYNSLSGSGDRNHTDGRGVIDKPNHILFSIPYGCCERAIHRLDPVENNGGTATSPLREHRGNPKGIG